MMSEQAAQIAEIRRWRNEVRRYLELFSAAFDELHSAVIEKVKQPGQYVTPHYDYPKMSLFDSGFPHFTEAGFRDDKAPRHYVSTIRSRGLLGLLGGLTLRDATLNKGAELASFLRAHKIGERLQSPELSARGIFSDRPVDELVGDAVERYLHLYGLDAPINPKRRDAIIKPLVYGTVLQTLKVRLIVPITLTHFEVDHFPLSETTYITRLSKNFQLARARINAFGSGAVRNVVGAATHAFVSTDWTLDVERVDDVPQSLNQSSSNVLDAVDSFFGSLRIVTGFRTGYAQLLWSPKRWALEYFCDLPPLYGTNLRRYPAEYDNYGWAKAGEIVTLEHLKEVRHLYKAVVSSQSEALRLALNRLNGCLTRTDAADAILDGTIGLELLLSDDENQALSYKLRLRAAALALLQSSPPYPASEIASKVKRLYKARSDIVHGRRKKRSKQASEPMDMSHPGARLLASELLRYVLKVLLLHPEYQDNPAKIDEGILLRTDERTIKKPAKRRSKTQKPTAPRKRNPPKSPGTVRDGGL